MLVKPQVKRETGAWGCFLSRGINQKGVVSVTVASDKPKSHKTTGSRTRSSGALPEKAVKKRLSELGPIVAVLSEDIRPLAMALATNCARLSVTMDVCWKNYSRDGAVVTYDNGGGQQGVRENPSYGAYVKASRELGSSIGKLIQMVGPGTVAADDLTDWQADQRARE
jgi:hypothetical protein